MLVYGIISIIYFIILFACGLAFKPIIDRRGLINSNDAFLNTFFIGIISLAFIASCLSLFFPLNQTILIAFVCLGLFGIIINGNTLVKAFIYLKQLNFIDFITLVLIFVFLVLISSNGIYNYDTGLYHIQIIKWTNLYPVVPGLGNLHGRFGLNSSFFNLSTVFSTSHFFSKELLVFPLNTICLYVFLVWQYFNIKKCKIKTDIAKIVFIVIVVLLFLRYQLNWISSTSIDTICAIISLIVLQKSVYNKFDGNLFFISSLIFTCITFKLSVLMLLLFIIPLIKKANLLSNLIKIFAVGVLLFSPFFIRNYFLTGYLIYPFPILDLFNPNWKIPLDDVINIKLLIETWAIIPDYPINEVLQLSFAEWFPIWLNRWDFLTKVILFSSLSLPVISVIHFFKKKYNSALVSLFTFVNLLFWFLIAPDPRFAHGFLIFAFAYTLFIIVDSFRYKLILTVVSFAFITLGLFIKLRKSSTKKHVVVFHMFKKANEILTYPKGFNEQGYQKAVFEKFNFGFEHYKPVGNDRCYDYKIPCTPTNIKGVILRGKSLKNGFKINTGY